MTTPIERLTELGQSLWYDNIQRRLLENGEMAAMIGRGEIRGVTSNPSIFNQAIAKSSDYDSALVPLAWSGWEAEAIFWQLAVEDIRQACDLFLPLYRQTEGADGYVSLEVSPYLAGNTTATIEQARHLWKTVDRPNLMVKIPATPAGLSAIRQAIAAGVNVNVTLIFSIERYKEVMDAYLAGLDERLQAGLEVAQIASVASFFVSRLDSKIDALLESIGSPEALLLRGKAAIANTKLAYAEFRKVFGGQRFARFQAAGCRLQRPLWASTSTKNPAYPDTLYVDELIGPATVNTVPPATLEAFRLHGNAGLTILQDLEDASQTVANLEGQGISMAKITRELEEEGVKAFADAFTDLLKTIDQRRQTAINQLGPLTPAIGRRVAHLISDSIPERIWEHDPTVWSTDTDGQDEIRLRLGWLDLPRTSRKLVKEIEAFATSIRHEGLNKFLLLGMGGSSLAPEVLSLFFQSNPAQSFSKERPVGGAFTILDSTDPAQVLDAIENFPPNQSLYIVSSKSGGTTEVSAMLDTFWELAGGDGSRFIAITDPGTLLDRLANQRGFRKTFLADPAVGGRYSALTHFGLVPAALMGIDLEHLLNRAAWMAAQCRSEVSGARNPGLVLGVIMGQAALDGRDKLTILADPQIASFGSWLEQLIAESSGKLGRGIIPVDLEPLTEPFLYGQDRLFAYLRATGAQDAAVAGLRKAGQPVLEFPISGIYDLGAEFYRWEFGIATACHILGVNPFDQPDVQDSKARTKARLAEYQKTGKLAEAGLIKLNDAAPALEAFLAGARTGDYIAINAYLPRNPGIFEELQSLRAAVQKKTKCATTLGFGPRFHHSTGQLHKGGPDCGLFLQIVADPVEDVEIPGQGLTFGGLERAQALGDYEALEKKNRRVLRVLLPSPEAMHLLTGMVG